MKTRLLMMIIGLAMGAVAGLLFYGYALWRLDYRFPGVPFAHVPGGAWTAMAFGAVLGWIAQWGWRPDQPSDWGSF